MPTAELANYVVAHSEYSAPMSRRNLISALIASESGTVSASGQSEDATEETVEISRSSVDENVDRPLDQNARKAH